MRFNAKNPEELKTMNLLQDGQYFYDVISAVDTQAKSSGADMIALQLRVYDSQDKAHLVFDNLIESMALKLYSFCETNGLLDKYNLGVLSAENCLGKKGYASIVIQPAQGQYGPKNSVKDYISQPAKVADPIKTDEFFDDPVLF